MPIWTFEADSRGYTLFREGIQQMRFELPIDKEFSRRSSRSTDTDRIVSNSRMFRETAQTICDRNNAEERRNPKPARDADSDSHSAMVTLGEDVAMVLCHPATGKELRHEISGGETKSRRELIGETIEFCLEHGCTAIYIKLGVGSVFDESIGKTFGNMEPDRAFPARLLAVQPVRVRG